MRASRIFRQIRRADLTVPLLLAIGLLVRGVLAPYTSVNYDDAPWFHTSLAGFYGLHLYDRPGFSYPPVWGYVLISLGSFLRLAGVGPDFFGVIQPDLLNATLVTGDFSTVVTSPAFNVLFKAVLIAFDAATAFLIYGYVRAATQSSVQAAIAFAAWFLNPFVIYESAVHGAADVLVGFFTLASVFLVTNSRGLAGGSAWILGVMTKLTPIVVAPQLLIALIAGSPTRQWQAILRRLGGFAIGSILALGLLLSPELIFGTTAAMIHNVFARAQEPLVVGGFSVAGVRYLKPMAWLLLWAFQNSDLVLRISSIAQVGALIAWTGWSAIMSRTSWEFALLAGSAGAIATFSLLSPVSNPQYILWWLPLAIVLVTVTKRGYAQLVILGSAPVVFSLAILGPVAIASPLAAYTHLLDLRSLGSDVVDWYVSPGSLWGISQAADFFAPTWIVTVTAVITLLIVWLRTPLHLRLLFARPHSSDPVHIRET